MTWWPGEQERFERFLADRVSRFAHRAVVLESLSATDIALYQDLFRQYEALLLKNVYEDEAEFADTVPWTNQNVW